MCHFKQLFRKVQDQGHTSKSNVKLPSKRPSRRSTAQRRNSLLTWKFHWKSGSYSRPNNGVSRKEANQYYTLRLEFWTVWKRCKCHMCRYVHMCRYLQSLLHRNQRKIILQSLAPISWSIWWQSISKTMIWFFLPCLIALIFLVSKT